MKLPFCGSGRVPLIPPSLPSQEQSIREKTRLCSLSRQMQNQKLQAVYLISFEKKENPQL